MNTSVTRPSVLGLLTSLFLLGAVATEAPRAQAVINTNGSFEATDPGVVTDLAAGIEGWVLEVAATVTPAPTFEIVDGGGQDGDQALKVSVAEAGTDPWNIQAVADSLPTTPGATYEYSVWARTESGSGTAAFTVGGYPEANFTEYLAIRDNVALTEEWQEFTGQFTLPANVLSHVRGPIHFSFAANAGQAIYIDNLRIVNPAAGAAPVIVEAESGDLGSEFETVDGAEGEPAYITITTDFDETTGAAGYPGAGRTASYEITFPEAGWYDLYARVYVNEGAPDDESPFNNDSFFSPDTFGVKDPALADDWLLVNGLASAGYSAADVFVTGGGGEGAVVWKWVNLTESPTDITPVDSFYVSSDALTVTFQIGARENGLRIDKLAFGRSDLFYTVANLDDGTPGSPDMGEGPVLPDAPLAQGLDKFLGNIYSPSQVENWEYYWNYVIAENAGKWGSVEGTRDQMNWAGLDASYALAQDNGLEYNFHVLLWGNQQPAWMNDLEPEEQLAEIREWMEAVAERYPDMDVVQVANEILPTHNPPDGQNGRANYKEALGGDGETGFDYVINGFAMAREIFPDARLMLNDYGILGSTTAARQYRAIIELLQERDLIDVIGVQGHAFSTRQGAPIQQVLDILAETGLPIQVTEFDVDGNPNNSAFVTPAQSDANQLRDMERIFPILWEHPAVEGITFWGWRPGLWRQDQEAYLVQSNGEERPALVWLQEYLEEYGTPPVGQPLNADGGFEGFALGTPTNTDDWFFQVSEAADATLAVVDSPVHEGSRALSVQVAGTAGANIQFSNQGITVPGPGTYRYSGWARASEDGARLQVIGDHQGGSYSWFGNTTVDLTTEWQEVAFEFEVPAESGGAAVEQIRATHVLKFAENVGKTIYLDGVTVSRAGATSAEPTDGAGAFTLLQNRPNPFRDGTAIAYELDAASDVSLVVFNALGQRVATLVSGPQPAGSHEVRFDAGDLAAGVYLYRLQVGPDVEIRRMTVVR